MDLITALAVLTLLVCLVTLILEIVWPRTELVVVAVGLIAVSVRRPRIRGLPRAFWSLFTKRRAHEHCLGSQSRKGPESYPGFLLGAVGTVPLKPVS